MSAPAKTYPAGPCREAWHGGLTHGILIECAKTSRHYKHESADKKAAWWGPVGLSETEMAIADRLRDEAVGA